MRTGERVGGTTLGSPRCPLRSNSDNNFFFGNTAGSVSRRIACIVSKIEWGDSRQQIGLKIQTNTILLSFSDSNLFSKSSVHPFAVNAHN